MWLFLPHKTTPSVYQSRRATFGAGTSNAYGDDPTGSMWPVPPIGPQRKGHACIQAASWSSSWADICGEARQAAVVACGRSAEPGGEFRLGATQSSGLSGHRGFRRRPEHQAVLKFLRARGRVALVSRASFLIYPGGLQNVDTDTRKLLIAWTNGNLTIQSVRIFRFLQSISSLRFFIFVVKKRMWLQKHGKVLLCTKILMEENQIVK